MTEEYNPAARDGDGDGMIQDGTAWERPAEPAVEEPAAEELVEEVEAVAEVAEAVILAPEPEETAPALTPVANGVIGSGKVSKKKPAAKPAVKEVDPIELAAVFATRNLVWQGVGKVVKGYNIVPKDQLSKWMTLETVREATPEEIKANLG
jgi:hypothetical protein